jgi:hypothetical protein
MPYCITLRARTDTRIITGWYVGSACRWSTDHRRRKVFDNKQDVRAVCHELRDLCPRNAKVINIEDAPDDLSREVRLLAISSPSVYDHISEPERLEHHTGEPLNPLVAWSIVLLASVALWGGLGLAISSVISALG